MITTPDLPDAAAFEAAVGDVFVVVVDEQHAFEARLDSVQRWSGRSFTLLFRAHPQAQVQQRIYRLVSDCLPPLDLFLVPLEPDAAGTRYEAVIT